MNFATQFLIFVAIIALVAQSVLGGGCFSSGSSTTSSHGPYGRHKGEQKKFNVLSSEVNAKARTETEQKNKKKQNGASTSTSTSSRSRGGGRW
ncbi:hypothetical protein GPALN_004064 [Globodera pallida]|nr:hypothetical protein GPALN_004064 [Globodera pallida]